MTNSDETQVDATDAALIRLLEADGRMPTATLAKRVGLSRTTVQARIDRLVARGVIAGFTVRLGEGYARSQVHGHVMMTVAPKQTGRIEASLKAIPQVRTLHSVSGVYDLVAMVTADSIAELDRVIDAIGLVDGVERTTSSIILSTRLQR